MDAKKLDISYLGKRDYIDVSTLSSALYGAIPQLTDNTKLKNFKFRVKKKVINECTISLYESELEAKAFENEATVVFNWDYEGKNYTAHFKETKTPITKRIPEIMEDTSRHISYDQQLKNVTLSNPVNDDSIYNLMKMGRIIVVEKYNLFPRVVRFHFDRLFNQEELKDVIMTAEFFASKDFYRLETFKEGKKFGEIIIKGLQPY